MGSLQQWSRSLVLDIVRRGRLYGEYMQSSSTQGFENAACLPSHPFQNACSAVQFPSSRVTFPVFRDNPSALSALKSDIVYV